MFAKILWEVKLQVESCSSWSVKLLHSSQITAETNAAVSQFEKLCHFYEVREDIIQSRKYVIFFCAAEKLWYTVESQKAFPVLRGKKHENIENFLRMNAMNEENIHIRLNLSMLYVKSNHFSIR